MLSLKTVAGALRKRWWVVLALTLIGGAAGFALASTATRQYSGSAQIFVSTSQSSTAADLAQGNTFTQARVQSYVTVATSPDVTQKVVEELGLRISADQLAGKIQADAPLNKVVIDITVTDQSAVNAATWANAVATQFSTVIEQLERTGSTGESPVKLTVTHPARVDDTPVSPNVSLDIALGIFIGAALGTAFVLLREITDTTVRTPSDVAALVDAPIIGVVPFDRDTSSHPIAFRGNTRSSRAEAYRLLRTNLQFVNVDNPPRVIAVTSAMPGEGKTQTAINLSAALAESGRRVCLVEADLRRPTVASTLGLVGTVGLTSVLIGEAEVESVLQNAGQNLAVLTSGQLPPNPTELLTSAHTSDLLDVLVASVDIVVIDTAPLLLVADGAVIAAAADATLLTVRSGSARRDQVGNAVSALNKVGVSPVGIVLSQVPISGRRAYSYQYYGEYGDPVLKVPSETPSVVAGTP